MKIHHSLLIFCFLQIWITGLLFRKGVLKYSLEELKFGKWGLDFMIGNTLLALLMIYSNFILGKIYWNLYTLLTILLFITWVIRSYRETLSIPKFSLQGLFIRKNLLLVIPLIFLVYCIFSVFLKAYYGPLEWDGFFIYGMQAKSYYYDRIITPEFMFDEKNLILSIVNYRYLIPMGDGWLLSKLGGPWDNAFAYLSYVYYLALLCFLYSLIKNYLSTFTTLIIVTLFAGLQQSSELGSRGMCDLALAFNFLAVIYFLGLWLNHPKWENLFWTGFFLISSALTKKEGTSFAILVVLVVLIKCLSTRKLLRKNMWNSFGIFLGILMIGYIPWFIIFFKAIPILKDSLNSSTVSLEPFGKKVTITLIAFWNEWIDLHKWGLTWLFIFSGMIYSIFQLIKRKNWDILLLWLIPILQGVIYLFTLLKTHNLVYYLSKTTDRLSYHLLPSLFILCIASIFISSQNILLRKK